MSSTQTMTTSSIFIQPDNQNKMNQIFQRPKAATKRSGMKVKLALNFEPGPYAVICGRGKLCSASPGNKHLRFLVHQSLASYSSASNKAEKSAIVSAIINYVRQTSPSGAFVKEEDNGEWWEVDESFAREKIGCIFRDLLHTQYRSSTKAKQARKKAQENGNVNRATFNYQRNWTQINIGGSVQSFERNAMRISHLQGEKAAHYLNHSMQGTEISSASTRTNFQNDMVQPPAVFSLPATTTRCTIQNSYEENHDISCGLYPGRAISPDEFLSSSSSVVDNSDSLHRVEPISLDNMQPTHCTSQNEKFQMSVSFPPLSMSSASPLPRPATGSRNQQTNTLSLLQDALGVVDMLDDDFDDEGFPDDLSDIFDDNFGSVAI